MRIDTICANERVPDRWVKIDDLSDTSGRCNRSQQYNAVLIQSLDDQPVGSTLEICMVKVVPLRWFMASSKWDSKKCGHPEKKDEDNVMVIKRAR